MFVRGLLEGVAQRGDSSLIATPISARVPIQMILPPRIGFSYAAPLADSPALPPKDLEVVAVSTARSLARNLLKSLDFEMILQCHCKIFFSQSSDITEEPHVLAVA